MFFYVGQALVTDCVQEEGHPKCRPCDKDSYNDEPNYEKSCKPCASCDQVNGTAISFPVKTKTKHCKNSKKTFHSTHFDVSHVLLIII